MRFWSLPLFLFVMMPCSLATQRSLMPGDRIRISCVGEPLLTCVRSIGAGGFATLPKVGAVNLATLTSEEAAAKVERILESSGLVFLPRVTVELLPTKDQPAAVLGQVEHAGDYPLTAETRLNDLLAWAEVTGGGDLQHVEITAADGTRTFWNVEAGANPLVRSGDRITVPTQLQGNQVSVIGGVLRPGAVDFASGMTLQQALEAAGGLSGHGNANAVEVERGPERYLQAGPSFQLMRGDVIKVGLTKKREFVTLVGAVVRPGLIAFREGMTLTQVIDAAGGLLENALTDQIVVRRVIGGLGPSKTHDYRAIKAGRAPDPVISNVEIIEVPGKW